MKKIKMFLFILSFFLLAGNTLPIFSMIQNKKSNDAMPFNISDFDFESCWKAYLEKNNEKKDPRSFSHKDEESLFLQKNFYVPMEYHENYDWRKDDSLESNVSGKLSKSDVSQETRKFLSYCVKQPTQISVKNGEKITISFPLILNAMLELVNNSNTDVFISMPSNDFFNIFHLNGLSKKVLEELSKSRMPSLVKYWQKASKNVAVVNKALRDHGSKITLQDINSPDALYMALGCGTRALWKRKGKGCGTFTFWPLNEKKAIQGVKYFSMGMNEANTLYTNNNVNSNDKTPIVELALKKKNENDEDLFVYIQCVDHEIKNETDLLLTSLHAYKNTKTFSMHNDGDIRVLIPVVDLYVAGDCSIFKNINVNNNKISESKMESSVEMDKNGFVFKIVFALSMLKGGGFEQTRDYLIDKPFIAFVAPKINDEKGDIEMLNNIHFACYIDEHGVKYEK